MERYIFHEKSMAYWLYHKFRDTIFIFPVAIARNIVTCLCLEQMLPSWISKVRVKEKEGNGIGRLRPFHTIYTHVENYTTHFVRCFHCVSLLLLYYILNFITRKDVSMPFCLKIYNKYNSHCSRCFITLISISIIAV